MNLGKLIRQMTKNERARNVQIRSGKATENGGDGNPSNINGGFVDCSNIPNATGDKTMKDQDLIILNLDGKYNKPVIIAKGGYMAP